MYRVFTEHVQSRALFFEAKIGAGFVGLVLRDGVGGYAIGSDVGVAERIISPVCFFFLIFAA